jgi:hypothetical protein
MLQSHGSATGALPKVAAPPAGLGNFHHIFRQSALGKQKARRKTAALL